MNKVHLNRIAVGTAFIGVAPGKMRQSPGSWGLAAGHVLSLEANEVATVVTAFHTNRDFLWQRDHDLDEPLKSVGEKLTHLLKPAVISALTSAHRAWWKRHWSTSGVKFGLDPDGKMSVAERMWYGTCYMLTVTNRVNYTTHTPPSGLWHNFYTSDGEGWPGYTTDINTQSPYFGAAAANHAETELAMIDLHDQFIPMGRRISQLAYECDSPHGGGVLLPVEIDAFGGTKIFDDQGLKSNGVLMAMVHVNHARLTGDISPVYNYLREVALFWQCYLVNTTLPDSEDSYVFNDLYDCCYEICSANQYGGETQAGFAVSHNPTNSLAMIKTLLEAMLDFSAVLGADADLRPIWEDILNHLAPYPVNSEPAPGINGSLFVDWEGAPNPPTGDHQMLGCIQIVYPAGQVSSSTANRTQYRAAKNLIDHISRCDASSADGCSLNGSRFHTSSDADCIIFQISTRLNYNQTAIYPDFAWAIGALRRDAKHGNLLQNGITQAQNAGGALQYVNELLVRSDEPFIRFFSGHFSSIEPSQHGLPLPLEAAAPAAAAHGACNVDGTWYNTNNDHPPRTTPFHVTANGTSWQVNEPNPWNAPVRITQVEVGATEGHPECGSYTAFEFDWPATNTEDLLTFTTDCEYLCFPVSRDDHAGSVVPVPFSRGGGQVPAGTCSGGSGGALRPWLNSSFSRMRVKGAQGTDACPLTNGLCTFLVDGSLSARGVVGSLRVFSERGGNFTFLSPFPAGVVPVVSQAAGGQSVAVRPWAPAGLFHLEPHERVFAFETAANSSYDISV